MTTNQTLERGWARLGAANRLAALTHERAAIFRAFPELRRAGVVTATAMAAGLVSRPKRRFSAAAKRRMSAGMRRYWARRKAAGK